MFQFALPLSLSSLLTIATIRSQGHYLPSATTLYSATGPYNMSYSSLYRPQLENHFADLRDINSVYQDYGDQDYVYENYAIDNSDQKAFKGTCSICYSPEKYMEPTFVSTTPNLTRSLTHRVESSILSSSSFGASRYAYIFEEPSYSVRESFQYHFNSLKNLHPSEKELEYLYFSAALDFKTCPAERIRMSDAEIRTFALFRKLYRCLCKQDIKFQKKNIRKSQLVPIIDEMITEENLLIAELVLESVEEDKKYTMDEYEEIVLMMVVKISFLMDVSTEKAAIMFGKYTGSVLY